jgi:hypothetical protein
MSRLHLLILFLLLFLQSLLAAFVWACCSGFILPVFEEVAVLLFFFVLVFDPVLVVKDVFRVGVVFVLAGALVAGGKGLELSLLLGDSVDGGLLGALGLAST